MEVEEAGRQRHLQKKTKNMTQNVLAERRITKTKYSYFKQFKGQTTLTEVSLKPILSGLKFFGGGGLCRSIQAHIQDQTTRRGIREAISSSVFPTDCFVSGCV